jgi:hypothetical protein
MKRLVVTIGDSDWESLKRYARSLKTTARVCLDEAIAQGITAVGDMAYEAQTDPEQRQTWAAYFARVAAGED